MKVATLVIRKADGKRRTRRRDQDEFTSLTALATIAIIRCRLHRPHHRPALAPAPRRRAHGSGGPRALQRVCTRSSHAEHRQQRVSLVGQSFALVLQSHLRVRLLDGRGHRQLLVQLQRPLDASHFVGQRRTRLVLPLPR